ncbi:MAG: N-acetylmuramoyl-L-alanine amidase [Anaerolineales bacterium]|nr:N-acetylmuramoyl-L-alanine amidase [Anaerolineales bacterium]
MQLKVWTLIIFISLLAVVGLSSHVAPAAGYHDPIIEELHFTGSDFSRGMGQGFVVSSAGLSMNDAVYTTIYTSPEIEAPLPFNAIVPQWQSNLPEGSSLALQVRTRSAVGVWSDWFEIHESDDWTLPEDEMSIGDMVAVPEADVTHTHIQFTISMSRYISSASPVLEKLTLTFIDSTAGPTAAEMLAQQQAIDAELGLRSYQVSGYPRPTVISREVWCLSVDCDYTDGLEYHPASHMVVHHTVSNNGSSNWAAVVRAIWSFHTYSREWGDIGYNYLVDMNGVIYEGHMNEDYENLDVVGTHASGANTGSMGTALIGTFTAVDYPNLPGIEPPAPMVNSLVELLSWKADQRSIDVYDASDVLPYIDWGLPHLMGHREVYGTTECPGDQAFALLPQLRDRVAANIGLTNDYLMVGEDGPYFTRSSATWYEGPNECGTNGHSYYTWSTTDPAQSTNWGEWRPPVAENGRYSIEVRVPYCSTGRSETDGATYTITHANGTSTVVVSHQDELGLWINLGEYNLPADGSTVIRLTDLTTTDDDLGLWFDDMRLRLLPPELSTTAPADTAWLNDPTVNFAWAFSNPTDVSTTTLQVSTNIAFTNLLVNKTLPGSAISYTHTFSENIAPLYWRVSVDLTGSNQAVTSAVSSFGVDTAVPTTTGTAIYRLFDNSYSLNWEGTDALSGVAGFDVAYRTISETTWTPWLTTTLNSSAHFAAPDPAQTYEFRIQATDLAGNIGQKSEPDLSTEQAIDLPHAIMLPLILKEN